MTQARRAIDILAPASVVYNTLTDYDHYTDLFPAMRRSRLLERNAHEAIAEFDLSLFRLSIYYSLVLTEEPFRAIRWRLKESNWLTRVEGSWRLEALDKSRTRATYTQSLSVKGFLPRVVATKLVDVHLPEMLEQLKTTVEDHL